MKKKILLWLAMLSFLLLYTGCLEFLERLESYFEGDFEANAINTEWQPQICEAESIITAGQKIAEIRDQIKQNIRNLDNLDFGIDIDRIVRVMAAHQTQEDAAIIRIGGGLHDLSVVENFLTAHQDIRTFWKEHRRINVWALTLVHLLEALAHFEDLKYLRPSIFDDLGVDDTFALADAIFAFSYQSETAEAFFLYLLEQFRITSPHHAANELPELAITLLPLPVTAVMVDGIPYDAIAIKVSQLFMGVFDGFKEGVAADLVKEIYRQFAIFTSNVDAYLDWYYSFFNFRTLRQLGAMIGGFFSRNRTAMEASQDFMMRNYARRIGRGASFEYIIVAMEENREELFDIALALASVLEHSSLEFYYFNETVKHITGDEFMASLIPLMDYLDHVVSRGLPLLGMGDMLDSEGILAVDVVNTAINFVPKVGLVAGMAVDVAALAITERLQRAEFRSQIMDSIQDAKRSILEIVRLEPTEET